jgi:hypothetical protein
MSKFTYFVMHWFNEQFNPGSGVTSGDKNVTELEEQFTVVV